MSQVSVNIWNYRLDKKDNKDSILHIQEKIWDMWLHLYVKYIFKKKVLPALSN